MVILVKDNVGTIRVFEALFRLECLPQILTADNAIPEPIQSVIDIGLQNELILFLCQADIGFDVLFNEAILLVPADGCTVEICVAADPNRQVTEVIWG